MTIRPELVTIRPELALQLRARLQPQFTPDVVEIVRRHAEEGATCRQIGDRLRMLGVDVGSQVSTAVAGAIALVLAAQARGEDPTSPPWRRDEPGEDE